MTTDCTNPTTVDTHVDAWMVGDYYESTADHSLHEIARRVEIDLRDVQYDDMVPRQASFRVTADTTGPVDVLRIVITGLADTTDGGECGDTMRTAFELANHYNRVNLTRPGQTRFVQCVIALHDDHRPAAALVGMMSDVLPDPQRLPAAIPETAGTTPVGPMS